MFSKAFFFTIRVLFKNSSLRAGTWKRIKNEKPLLYKIKQQQDSFYRKKQINNPQAAVLITLFWQFFLVAICFVPAEFVERYFFYLQWVSFPKVENTYEIISTTLATAATIIGLSFVVIGFLFETARNKTQRTLEDLFRTTSLYYVFSISVISILVLVFVNTFKFSFDEYIAGNFAILSSLLLSVITVSIGTLFYKVLLYLNPDKIAGLAKANLVNLARFALLKDSYIVETGKYYEELMLKQGLTRGSEFVINPTHLRYVTLPNEKDMLLRDIWLPVLLFCNKRILRRRGNGAYIALHCDKLINGNQIIFTYPNDTVIHKLESKIIQSAIQLKKNERVDEDYEIEKSKLQMRVLRASEIGDAQMLNDSLDDLNTLYEIYYNGL